MAENESDFATMIDNLIAVAERYGYGQVSLLVWLLSPSTYVENDGIPASLAVTDPQELPRLAERTFGIVW